MTDTAGALQDPDLDHHTETLAAADHQITTDDDHQHTVLNAPEAAHDQAPEEQLLDLDPDHLTRHVNNAQRYPA